MFDEVIAVLRRHDLSRLEELLALRDIDDTDPEGRSLLMHAILTPAPSLEVVQLLIDRRISINFAEPHQSWTALHFAARDQRREIAGLLLAYGAEVDPLDAFGNTPLWRCVMAKQPDLELVQLLLNAGANGDQKNRFGISPRDHASMAGKHDLLELFASAEAE